MKKDRNFWNVSESFENNQTYQKSMVSVKNKSKKILKNFENQRNLSKIPVNFASKSTKNGPHLTNFDQNFWTDFWTYFRTSETSQSTAMTDTQFFQ